MSLPTTLSASTRRLTVERERELYETTLDMLHEVGYEALTMDAIAARTHSSKATLYRQWGGKAQLVVAAIHSSKAHHGHKPDDTGSLRGDLGALADRLDSTSDRDTTMMSALGHAIHTNPDLKQAFHQVVIQPERENLKALLQRAIDRGEIAADCPANEFLFHMLVGAVIGQSLVDRCRVDAEYLKRYRDAVVLPALTASPIPSPA
ncbi:MAG: TetR/AcrR family transcriptional regulator [Mycobacteriales bacterium]